MPEAVQNPALEEEPRQRSGCLGFGFKTLLGIGAFLTGVAAVGVLLGPSLLSPLVKGWVEGAFGRTFRGSLEVDALELSWTREQRIESASLLDPEGGEVARVWLRAPSILKLLEIIENVSDGQAANAGFWMIEFEADLEVDDEGRSNLERALAVRENVEMGTDARLERGLKMLHATVQFRGRRFSWTDRKNQAPGTDFALRDLEGVLELDPNRLHLELEGEPFTKDRGDLRIDWSVRRESPSGEWLWDQAELVAEARCGALPTVFIDELLHLDGLLVDALGPQHDLSFSARARQSAPYIQAAMLSRHGRLSWTGELRNGALVAEGSDRLHVLSDLSPLFAERIVENLLPLLAQVQKPADAEPVELIAHDVVLPLRGPLEGISASVELDLGEVDCRFLPKLELYVARQRTSSSVLEGSAMDGDELLTRVELAPLKARVEDGRVTYREASFTVAERLYPLQGSYDFARRNLDLVTRLPLEAMTEVPDAVRGRFGVPVELFGSLDDPRLSWRVDLLGGDLKQLLLRAFDTQFITDFLGRLPEAR